MHSAKLSIDLLVCGFRRRDDDAHLRFYLKKIKEKGKIRRIIAGGETGHGMPVIKYARENRIPLIEKRVDLKKFGRKSLPAYNKEMLDLCNKEHAGMVLTCWDSVSLATESLLKEAERRDIPCMVHRFGTGTLFSFDKPRNGSVGDRQ